MSRSAPLLPFFLLLLLLLLIPCHGWAQGPEADWIRSVEALRRSTAPVDEAELLRVAASAPSWRALRECLRAPLVDALPGGRLVTGRHRGTDGVERPWVLGVPASYRPDRDFPLLVHLHGAVSRPELRDDPEGYARSKPYLAFCETRGWLCLFVFGQKGATWWDEVGMENVEGCIRDVKRRYAVDDDRVWLEGFSDGGSAAFLYGMVRPDPFGALVALNGHMGVGSLDGELSTYMGNLANVPVYATTTDGDELYPTARMRPTIEAAIEEGGRIFYRARRGRHAFDFADDELPLIGRFLEAHPRDPHPSRIDWEAGDLRFGRCHWIEILDIAPKSAAPWHRDRNVVLTNHRLTIGFMVDEKHAGPGIRVASLSDGSTLAKRIGLKAGDLLLRADEIPLSSNEDLERWKSSVRRGATSRFVLRRGDRSLELRAEVPPVEHYFLFTRRRPSAKVRARYMANRFDVETSRVARLRIEIHEEMIDLDQDVEVRIDGAVRHRGRVRPDPALILRRHLGTRDRRCLPVAVLDFEL